MSLGRDYRPALAWLCFASIGAFIVAWAQPRSLQRLEDDRAELLQRMHRAEDGAAELRALANDLSKLRRRALGVLKDIPQDSGFAVLMGSLGANLDALGATDREITNGGPMNGDDARSLPMRVRMTADFPSVFATLEWVESLPRLVRVQRVQIESVNKKEPWDARVKAEVTLDVFFAPVGLTVDPARMAEVEVQP